MVRHSRVAVRRRIAALLLMAALGLAFLASTATTPTALAGDPTPPTPTPTEVRGGGDIGPK